MSIDIGCYTSICVDELKDKLSVVKVKYSHLFDGPYIMFNPHKILTHQQFKLIDDRVERYNQETKLLIAEEFGLTEPKSYFLIAVNDKSFAASSTSEIADALKKELGKENIIVLLNGEDLI